jgi:hypothetical protein
MLCTLSSCLLVGSGDSGASTGVPVLPSDWLLCTPAPLLLPPLLLAPLA